MKQMITRNQAGRLGPPPAATAERRRLADLLLSSGEATFGAIVTAWYDGDEATARREIYEPAPSAPTIAYDDYVRLWGLMALAADHRQALRDIERSACRLLGEGPLGHTADAVWCGDKTPRELLDILGIPVPEAPLTPMEHANA